MALEAFRATLRGLSGVNVQVEPVNADAERDGLLRADLQTDVESALREAGVEVVAVRSVVDEFVRDSRAAAA